MTRASSRPVRQRQAVGRDREDMCVRVGAGGGLDGPVGGFLEPAEPDERHGARAEHAEQHRIEGAELAREIGGCDRGLGIARLRVDEGQRVVASAKFGLRSMARSSSTTDWSMLAAQPQRPAHGPVRGRIAIVDHQALAGGVVGSLDLRLALRPALEGVLEMREGQAGIGAREGRIEAHGHLEEMAGLLVVGLVEAVHVPQAAVMGLPGVQRVRRLQDGAVALDRLDLAGDGGDDPVADLVEDEERVVQRVVEDFRPDDAGGARLGQLDGHGEAAGLAPQRAADDIVDVEHAAGLLAGRCAARAGRTRCPAR